MSPAKSRVVKTVSVNIADRYATRTHDVSLRVGAIILRVTEDADLIDKWVAGRIEIHWRDDSVKMHLTKVEA